MKTNFKNNTGIIGIIVAVIISLAFITIASFRNFTQLEIILFQIFILIFSIWGSKNLGEKSAKNEKLKEIKPYARSSFRRVINLYGGLSRLATEIENQKSKKGNSVNLEKLEAMVTENIATADDAIEDWREIIPKEVSKVKEEEDNKNDRQS